MLRDRVEAQNGGLVREAGQQGLHEVVHVAGSLLVPRAGEDEVPGVVIGVWRLHDHAGAGRGALTGQHVAGARVGSGVAEARGEPQRHAVRVGVTEERQRAADEPGQLV